MRRVPLAMTSVLAASLGAAGAYGRPLPKGRLAALARPGAAWTLPVHDPPAPWGPDAAPTPASVTVTVTSVRPDGTFAFAPANRAGALCVGFGATDPTCGDDPCYAWICLDEHGVIGVGGIGDDNGFDFGFVPDRFPGDAP